MTPPPPPPRRSGGGFVQALLALCAIAAAVACGGVGWQVARMQERAIAQEDAVLKLQARVAAVVEAAAKPPAPPKPDDGLAKLDERLRNDAELARTTTALTAFDATLETKAFEFEHGLACLAFFEQLSRKAGFETFAADPDRKFAKTIYSKAVFDLEGVNYATKDADHPMMRDLKACVAPGAGQERIAFPDELSVIVFRERFDAQVDALFYPRFNLVLFALSNALREYQDLGAPAKKLIDAEVGDVVCKTALRKLYLRKGESALVRTKLAEGKFRVIDGFVAANCPGSS